MRRVRKSDARRRERVDYIKRVGAKENSYLHRDPIVPVPARRRIHINSHLRRFEGSRKIEPLVPRGRVPPRQRARY